MAELRGYRSSGTERLLKRLWRLIRVPSGTKKPLSPAAASFPLIFDAQVGIRVSQFRKKPKSPLLPP
ncbi:hypothetical protein DQG13_18245 [Paenibacillus sp. YN15]|nr:hypothetical protein DQG13_18245 [Paenibacillus sp. YN15]